MRNLCVTALLLVMLIAAPVMAQQTASGRYTMTPSGEGMLRLDTQTGAVSHCMQDTGRWVCKSIADDRNALENEIDRLSNENRQMRAELAKRGLEPPPQPELRGEAPRSWLPSDSQVEEFMSFFEKIMRRFREYAESMQDNASPERP
jgi:hypothetical protein